MLNISTLLQPLLIGSSMRNQIAVKRVHVRVVAIISAVMLVFGLATSLATPSAEAAATGTVQCANGLPIQGIWVEAQNSSKSGWATRWNLDGANWKNGWSHAPLGTGDSYHIRVGCGSWAPTYTSGNQTGLSRHFICVQRYGSAVCYDA